MECDVHVLRKHLTDLTLSVYDQDIGPDDCLGVVTIPRLSLID